MVTVIGLYNTNVMVMLYVCLLCIDTASCKVLWPATSSSDYSMAAIVGSAIGATHHMIFIRVILVIPVILQSGTEDMIREQSMGEER
jgi:hypothetical protein